MKDELTIDRCVSGLFTNPARLAAVWRPDPDKAKRLGDRLLIVSLDLDTNRRIGEVSISPMSSNNPLSSSTTTTASIAHNSSSSNSSSSSSTGPSAMGRVYKQAKFRKSPRFALTVPIAVISARTHSRTIYMASSEIKTYLVSKGIANDVHGKSSDIRFFLSSAAHLLCNAQESSGKKEGGGGGFSAGSDLDLVDEYEVESISGEQVSNILLYARL